MNNKVPQQINDIVGDNVKKLAQLFPSVVKDGEVDFEALKEELGQYEEVGSEKYELTWAGKKNAKRIAQEDVIGRTLKFIPEDSKDADTTENLYIEGDNLEVLKLLRQNYYGAIKMIYIDPPYNTGNDFVYNDSFEMSESESNIVEGTISVVGEKYVINNASTNKYHAKNPKQISSKLVESNDLSICVLNIQAFNKDTNILRKTDEYEQNLWEDIKYIKPIVIIDEPQKIEGTAKKKSKSLVAIEELKPLFTLRYSATHKQLYKEALKDPSIGIYFIVETKAGKTWADLTDVEKNKIHCGELHFKAVSDDTKFDWVNGYEDFVNKFGVADSNMEDL